MNEITPNSEIDLQVKTAKQYPRDVADFTRSAQQIIDSIPGVAEACYYVLPRGSKTIEGASIRLAEIAVSCWGNIHAGTRVVSNDGRSVVAEAVVWDLEKNIRISQQVKRSIVDSRGNTYSDNMQQTTIMAAQSIAFRNAVFKVLPRCIIDTLMNRAKYIVQTGIKKEPIEVQQSKIDKVVHKLDEMGIKEERLLKMLSLKKIEQINSSHYDKLIGIGTAVKEGISLEAQEEEVKYISYSAVSSLKKQIAGRGLAEDNICDALGVDSLIGLPQEKMEDALELINHGS